MNVAIIGCGLIGKKRAQHLFDCRLLLCVDSDLTKAEMLAKDFPHCKASANWQDAISHPAIDIVIIATHHIHLFEIGLAAISAKKHVLLEKPGSHAAANIATLIKASKEKNVHVRVGFNHRYHPALQKARELVDHQQLGELMFIRARYGHGGRLGYDKEWRANKALSGGGELLDQGVHLIDLARWFLGDFTEIDGSIHTFFWDMPVEDNGFLLLKTAKKQVAFLHASWTEWKNTFSFEIFGRDGKIDIQGLGGSYGLERLTFYQMSKQMGPPKDYVWEFDGPDESFAKEFADFLVDIKQNRAPSPNLQDAHAAVAIVEAIYAKTISP